MKMKPILFNTEMVRAILDGNKTVTRRVVKEPYYIDDEEASRVSGLAIHRGTNITDGMPYPWQPYRPGDILYVRESFCPFDADHVVDGMKYAYKADATPEGERARKDFGYKWRPSIHMPREVARIFLRVTDVRVERLQDIDDDGVIAEGLEIGAPFDELWDTTIKPADRARYGWEANPYVWVIAFERINREEIRNEPTDN